MPLRPALLIALVIAAAGLTVAAGYALSRSGAGMEIALPLLLIAALAARLLLFRGGR